MNRWQEQLANHAIHETLREAREFVETEFEDTSSETEMERRRFLKLLDFFQTVLEQIDAEIVPFNLLDNINNGMRHQNVWNQLAAYSSTGNDGNLTNANNAISAQLPAVIQLAVFSKEPALTKQIKTLNNLVDTFADSIDQKLTAFSERIDATEHERKELGQRLEGLSSSVDEKKTETEEQVSSLIKSSSSILDEADREFRTKIDEFLEDARSKHSNILELHEIVAGDSVAAGYLQRAGNERFDANLWRWVSIGFILSTALWVGFSYLNPPIVDMASLEYWGQFLKGLSVAGVLLFGAVYTSKQSNLHRKNEQRTQWLALEVKAIDPFIASLGADDQSELKKNLSEKLFGQMNNREDESANAINEHVFSSVSKTIINLVKAARS